MSLSKSQFCVETLDPDSDEFSTASTSSNDPSQEILVSSAKKQKVTGTTFVYSKAGLSDDEIVQNCG